MWSKMDSQLAGITRISELKWRAHSPGCWEHPSDFSSLSVQEFLCYGNIPIVAKLESEIMLDDRISWWIRASLVHFPCRLSRRSYSGRTFFPRQKARDDSREVVLPGACKTGHIKDNPAQHTDLFKPYACHSIINGCLILCSLRPLDG